MTVVTTVHPITRCAVTTGLTSHATAKNRLTIAHGLEDFIGIDRLPRAIICAPTATNDDTTVAPSRVDVVSFDKTNVVVKSDGTAVPFTLIAFY